MKHQHGIGLLTTLIGLLIGSLSALAMMTMFRSVVQNAIGARENAAHDGVVASALLAVQQDIQKAGFGIESATAAANCANLAQTGPSATVNSDLVLISNAALSSSSSSSITLSGSALNVTATPQEGNALIWRWIDGGQSYCAGVVAAEGGLRALRQRTCSSATNWSALAWSSTELIPRGILTDSKAFRFTQVRKTSCWPYGKASNLSGVSLTLVAGNSSSGLSSSQTVCLPNICR